MLRVAIIGAGFSGTLLAVHLLQKCKDHSLEIYLIDKDGQERKGAAYSTNKDYHLLNVKAQNMSAFTDDPDHFVNWLVIKDIPLSASGHMPRKIYRHYLQDILTEAIEAAPKGTIELINSYAENIFYSDNGLSIKTKEKVVYADKVVLALGNYPPSPLSNINYETFQEKYCPDPWAFSCADILNKEDTVLIIGTGLTMADTCITLGFNNHNGKIYSISTHGFVPAVHKYTSSYPAFIKTSDHKYSALELFQLVRKHIKIAGEQDIDWRCVVDSIRPFIQKLWINLELKERKTFLKYLNRRWSIARHRIPPEYDLALKEMMDHNQLQILSGRIRNIFSDKKIVVEYQDKASNKLKKLQVDFIINCTGPEGNYTKIKDPFINSLLTEEFIQPGPLKIGVNADENGMLINKYNKQDLFTLGPPLIGVLFETTAVPELRVQAKELAARILRN